MMQLFFVILSQDLSWRTEISLGLRDFQWFACNEGERLPESDGFILFHAGAAAFQVIHRIN